MIPKLLFVGGCALLLLQNLATAQDCSLINHPPEFRTRLAWQSAQDGPSVVSAPMVANMNPQTDSIPEIIVIEGSQFVFNRIQFYRGDGSNAANPRLLTVPGGFESYPAPSPTIGDVNGDGIPELLMACADRRIRVFNNYTEAPGQAMTLWITANGLLDFGEQRPLLADFDGDGIPEVYAGSDIYKFDFSNPGAPSLSKIINGPNTQGRAAYALYAEGSCNPTAVDILSVADCNGDPDCAGLELVAGPIIYSIDTDLNDGDGYEIKVQRNLNTMNVPANSNYADGYTSVADIDLDGILDVIVTSSRQTNQYGMYIWNKNGFLRFFPYPTNPVNSGSLACVANVFDDREQGFAVDMPEVLVCSSFNLTCYSLQAATATPLTPYWWNLPTTDFSGWTGSTVYDFNGDGISEIVYRDERDLRILYGGGMPFPAGVDAERNWFKTPCFSITSDEYPVVADVDNDGETEITVTGRITANFGNYRGRLRVYESDSAPWVPCRNVWNQFNYFIVNVNDDLSIPAVQEVHHLELPAAGSGVRPLNTYLSQRPLLNDNFLPFIPLPDASALTLQVNCAPDSVTVQLEICNPGEKVLPSGTPVTFYQSDPTLTVADLLGDIQWTTEAIPKDSCKIFSFTVPNIPGIAFGVVNDDASIPTPFQLALDFPVTEAFECNYLNNIFQFEIFVSPPPFELGPDFGACQDTTLVLEAGPGFAQYLWQDGSTNAVFQAQQAGLFWVETTDFCAQKQRDSIQIEIFEAPSIQLDTIQGDCSGNPAIVTASAQGMFTPHQFLWSSGDTAPSIVGLADGMYTVTVTNARGCTSTQSTWVNAGGNLQISGFVAAPILCFGQNGALDLSFQAGNPPYDFQWSDGSQTQNVPNAPAGNYSVTVTDADQCRDTLQIALTQPEALISSGLAALPSCPGLATGEASFLGAGQGTPPYSLLWSNNETSATLSDLPAGTYQLSLSDANGCTLVEQIQVPEYVAPNTEILLAEVSCFGANDGSIALNLTGGSPGFGFLWSNNATTNQIQSLQPGNYALTLTFSAGNCTQSFDFQVTEPLPILLSTTADPLLCHGLASNIDLTVQNGVLPLTYLWSNNALSEDLNDVGAGAYQVTVTDAQGCSEVISVDLNEPSALLSAGITSASACPGEANGSAAFLGASQGTPPYTLLWSNNETAPNQSNLPAGIYQLTLTDANGCTLVEQAQVSEFLSPTIQSIPSDVTCFGLNNGSISVNLSGGSPGFAYSWSNAETTSAIQNLAPGDYAITLTFADGICAQNIDFQIIEPPLLLIADSIVSPVTCFGENNGTIDLSAQGGVEPYHFQWTNGQTTEDLAALPAGNYALTLSDENGCTLQAMFELSQPEALTFTEQIGADTCQSANGTLAVFPSGGIPPYQFDWSNASTDPSQTALGAGLYLLTLSDANGCLEYATIPVPAYGETPVLNPFTDLITCAQTMVNVGVTANQNNLQYTWIAPNGSLPDAPAHPVQIAGTYLVTATNAFGCQTSAQIEVLEDLAFPTAEAGPPVLEIWCDESSALLDASGSSQGNGFLNRWIRLENGSITLDTAALLLPIVESGLYVHSVVNLQNGCAALDSIWVQWDAPIVASLAVDSIRCFGDNDGQIVVQNASGGTAPLFYSINNQPFTTFPSFNNLAAGNYVLRIRDDFGCTWEQTVLLTEPPALSVELTASNTSLVLGQSLQLNALPMPNFVTLAGIDWEPESLEFAPMSLQQRLKPEAHTEFVVRITDLNGCVAEDRLWVSVFNHNIYVPNIILPGTESNSGFTIFAGDGVLEVRSLQIFDRWGEQVFQRQGFLPNDPVLGWDGSYRGQPMNPGVFVWSAEVLLQDGQSVFLKGDVTVAR